MKGKDQEIEIKYYVQDLGIIEVLLQELGANKVQERTYEYNLRFDTQDHELTRKDQVLRLRKDTADRVTYKGPGFALDGVYHRDEIEFMVSDFDATQAFLEALGYRVSLIYEKYRTVYTFDDILVALDELPIGNFIEIEGPGGGSIREASQKLGLLWSAHITESYASLFQNACQTIGIRPSNLTFADFANVIVLPGHLGVDPADRSSAR